MKKEVFLVAMLALVVGVVSVGLGAVMGLLTGSVGSVTSQATPEAAETVRSSTSLTRQNQGSKPNLMLVSRQSSARVGEEVPVDIFLSAGEGGVWGADVAILYDKNVLSVVDADLQTATVEVVPGKIFQQPVVLANRVDGALGKVLLSIGTFKPFSGQGVYGTITFRAKKAGMSTLSFVPSPETKISVNSEGGDVKIDGMQPINITVN